MCGKSNTFFVRCTSNAGNCAFLVDDFIRNGVEPKEMITFAVPLLYEKAKGLIFFRACALHLCPL